jgi:alpha-tubulin suppressor-like RCC1 family protein
VTAGEDFSCARIGGQVVCWGLGGDGQLGDGRLDDSPGAPASPGSRGLPSETPSEVTRGPVMVAGLGDAVRLTAGRAHACAIRASGAVVCWGNGTQGQLGEGLVTNRAAPVSVEGLADAIDVAAGGLHTCALRRTSSDAARGAEEGGRVVCWGGNGAGQLGDGSTMRRLRPASVRLIEDARAVFAGDQHTCVIRADGDLFCFGGNRFGQLGEGTTLAYPVPVPALGLRDVALPGGAGARGVALGDGFTCALRREGTVWCFGDDRHGQIGARELRPAGAAGSTPVPPVRVPLPGELRAVTAGAAHTCALLATGAVWCWGEGQGGRLGDGTLLPRTTPAAVRLPAGVTELHAGAAHTCGRTLERRLWCWGRGDAGQIGSGEAADALAPLPIEPLRAVEAFATGEAHTCAVSRGQLWCWGRNQRGQLGLDGAGDVLEPTLVPGLEGVVEVVAGAAHTCVRLGDPAAERGSRDVRCFGDPRFGLLGDGSADPDAARAPSPAGERPDPLPPGSRRVQLDRAVVALAAGAAHTCARDGDGRVLCWGRGERGQLGWGTTADRAAPIEVPGLAGVSELAVGREHTCALGSAGVACFGANGAGQLGLPPGADALAPHDVPDSRGAVLVAAGAEHTCVLQGGALRCFGADGGGQLGSARPLFVPRARHVPLVCER